MTITSTRPRRSATTSAASSEAATAATNATNVADVADATATTFAFPGVPWISLTVSGKTGTVTVGGISVPVVVDAPSTGSIATVDADLHEVTFAAIVAASGNASSASGGANPLAALPASLGAPLLQAAVSQVRLSVDTAARSLVSAELTIGTEAAWELIPGTLAAGDLGITVHVERGAGGPSMTGSVSGSIRLGDVTVPITVGRASAAQPWTISIPTSVTGGVPLPGLASLACLLGGDLAGHLPTEMPSFAGIVLSEAAIVLAGAGTGVRSVRLGVATAQPWSLPDPIGLTLETLRLSLHVDNPADPAARSVDVTIAGESTLAGARFGVAVDRSSAAAEAATWRISGGLLDGEAVSSAGIARAYDVSLPSDVPELALSALTVSADLGGGEFTLEAASSTDWTLPLGVDGIGVGGLAVRFTRHAPDERGGTVEGRVSGVVHLGGIDVPVSYALGGDRPGLTLSAHVPTVSPFALVGDLCGAATLAAVQIPQELAALSFTDVDVELDALASRVSVAASGPGFQRVQIVVRKVTTWGFAIGIQLADTYRFSSLSSALGGLDSVHLPDAFIVISSFDDTTFTFDELITSPGTGVQRGATVDGRLDLSGLGADKFLGRSHLDVSADIGTSLSSLALDAQIGDVAITDGVVLKDARFELVPDPENVSVSVSGEVDVTLDASDLRFVGGVRVVPNGISFFATMLGTWQDPFGAQGIALTDVSLEIGSDFEGVPSIGIAGGLTVGTFTGSAAVAFNSELPSQSVLIVAFTHLSLLDIVDTFCPPEVTSRIPADVATTLGGVSLDDVELYVVPQDTQIGALTYEQGLRARGTLHVAGLTASAHLEIDQEHGVDVSGTLSPIHLDNIFSLTSDADPGEGAALELAVTTTSVPAVSFTGRATLLGLTAAASVSLNDAGFAVHCSGRVFGLFDADLRARGGHLQSSDGFAVSATMGQDFLADLTARAASVLQQAGAQAQGRIAAAQSSVTGAQRDLDTANASVAAARGDLAAQQAEASKKIGTAQADVTRAQSAVTAIDQQIAVTRASIQSERDAAAGRIRDAQSKVDTAQASVNSLDSQVSSLQGQIDRLNADIRWWNRWYANLAWYDKAWGWTRLGAEVGWRGTQVAALSTGIAGVRASELVAVGALQAAKQVLSAAAAAASSYPIDQDPRITTLLAARMTTTGGLLTAQGALAAAQQLTVAGISAATQAVNAAMAQVSVASFVLTSANAGLDGVRHEVGALADLAGYVAQHGLGALLDVRRASFDAELTAATAGSITLDAEVVFQGTPQHVSVAFSFHDLLAGATSLAKAVVPSLPI